jgi:hypothetical protein
MSALNLGKCKSGAATADSLQAKPYAFISNSRGLVG